MNNYSNNIISINRKSAGASAGGKKVGGQFAATAHAPSPVRLGRHAVDADKTPDSLLMAHFQDPGLVNDLGWALTRGKDSQDPAYYEEEFAQLLPNLDRGEAGEFYLRAMDEFSDGGNATPTLVAAAAKDTADHPGGPLARGYVPAEPTKEDRGTRQHPVVTGSKYQEGFRDVASISKDIRSDLKHAVAANYLPAGLSYSVKSHKYAGGQSLDVTVMGLSDEDRYEPVLTDHYGKPLERKESKELRKRLEKIAESYNRVDRDNYISGYYSTAIIEDDRSRDFREREAAERKARATKR